MADGLRPVLGGVPRCPITACLIRAAYGRRAGAERSAFTANIFIDLETTSRMLL
jgi:hypothetical protein